MGEGGGAGGGGGPCHKAFRCGQYLSGPDANLPAPLQHAREWGRVVCVSNASPRPHYHKQRTHPLGPPPARSHLGVARHSAKRAALPRGTALAELPQCRHHLLHRVAHQLRQDAFVVLRVIVERRWRQGRVGRAALAQGGGVIRERRELGDLPGAEVELLPGGRGPDVGLPFATARGGVSGGVWVWVWVQGRGARGAGCVGWWWGGMGMQVPTHLPTHNHTTRTCGRAACNRGTVLAMGPGWRRRWERRRRRRRQRGRPALLCGSSWLCCGPLQAGRREGSAEGRVERWRSGAALEL